VTWVKIDDQFQDHPSMVGLSMQAIGLWVCGLAYCARYLTDGVIPKKALYRVCPQPDAESIVAELVEAGRWEDRADHWRANGYLDYNPSRARVEAIRASRAEAGAAGGRAKAQVEAAAKNDADNLLGNSAEGVMPPARPVPLASKKQVLARAMESDFEEWWLAYPRHLSKPQARKTYAAKRKAGASRDALLAAAHRFADHCRSEGTEPKFIKYGSSFLNNGWEDWLPGGAAETEAKSRAGHVNGQAGPIPTRPPAFQPDDTEPDFSANASRLREVAANTLRRAP
jgi:hypothetical protein